MKKSSALLLLPLLVVSLITFVAAQSILDQTVPIAFETVAGIFGWVGAINWANLIILLIVFAMLLVTFGDVISQFSAFRKWTSWLIALGLSLIAVISGTVFVVTKLLIYITIWMGVFSVLGAVVFAFAAFFALHWLGAGVVAWFAERAKRIKSYKTQQTATRGLDTLVTLGKKTEEG